MHLVNLSCSVHNRIWLCTGHGVFWDDKAAPLGGVHRLCRRRSSHINLNVVSTETLVFQMLLLSLPLFPSESSWWKGKLYELKALIVSARITITHSPVLAARAENTLQGMVRFVKLHQISELMSWLCWINKIPDFAEMFHSQFCWSCPDDGTVFCCLG